MPPSNPASAPHQALSALLQTELPGTIHGCLPHLWFPADTEAEQSGSPPVLLHLTPPVSHAEGMSSSPPPGLYSLSGGQKQYKSWV